jgi:hypothetical protein
MAVGSGDKDETSGYNRIFLECQNKLFFWQKPRTRLQGDRIKISFLILYWSLEFLYRDFRISVDENVLEE